MFRGNSTGTAAVSCAAEVPAFGTRPTRKVRLVPIDRLGRRVGLVGRRTKKWLPRGGLSEATTPTPQRLLPLADSRAI